MDIRELLLEQEAEADGFPSVSVLSDVDRQMVKKAREKGKVDRDGESS
jgi:predicted Rdx family selenoprotein